MIPSRLAFSVALVPVKLLLEVGLGILDAHQCAQRSLECFTANRADSDRWNASEMFYEPKSTLCHARSFLQAEKFDDPYRFKTAPLSINDSTDCAPLLFCGN